MNIVGVVNESFNEAVKALVMGTSAGSLARARERVFVKTLVTQLEEVHDDDSIRVFSPYGRGNMADFGTEQLLHDICVCRIGGGVTAERKPNDFLYIEEALWQIEVDFSREWQQALHAINRLNCGSAANKLLIASQLDSGGEIFVNTLKAPSAVSDGMHYLALIPHPKDWDEIESGPAVWRMDDGEWVEAI